MKTSKDIIKDIENRTGEKLNVSKRFAMQLTDTFDRASAASEQRRNLIQRILHIDKITGYKLYNEKTHYLVKRKGL